MALRHAFRRLSPIQRDGLLFVAAMLLLLTTVWFTVSYGVSFTGPERGIQAWAVALLAAAFLVFSAVVWYWYHVSRDEREPARGEFTRAEGGGVRHGEGSFRPASRLGPGARAEPHANIQDLEPSRFPRTSSRQSPTPTMGSYYHAEDTGLEAPSYPRTRWRTGALMGAVGTAILVGAVGAWYALRTADPLSPLLFTILVVVLVLMGGILLAGDHGQRAS
jgi:hypothetical protein